MSEYFYHPIAPPQATAYDYSQQYFDAPTDYAAPVKQQQLPVVDFDF